MTPGPAPDARTGGGRGGRTRGRAVAAGDFRRDLASSLVAAALVPLIAFGALALLQVDAAVSTSLQGQVRAALTGAAGLLARDHRDLVETTRSYATWPALAAAVARGDVAGLQADVVDFQVGLGDLAAVVVTAGDRVATGGEKGITGALEEVARRAGSAPPVVEDVGPRSVGTDAGVYDIAAIPVVRSGETIGAVAMARRLDAPTILAVSQATGFEVAITSIAGGDPVVTDAALAARVAGSPPPADRPEVAIRDGFAVGRAAIVDADGLAVGTLVVANAVDLLDVVIANLVTLVGATLALAAAGAVLLAGVLGIRLRRRTDAVAGWVDAIAAGDPPPQPPVADTEMRNISRAVDDLAATLRARADRLRAVLDAVAGLSPRLGAAAVAEAGTVAARRVFEADEAILLGADGAVVAGGAAIVAGGAAIDEPPDASRPELGAPLAIDPVGGSGPAGAPSATAPAGAPGATAPTGAPTATPPAPARLLVRGARLATWEDPDRAIFELYARLLGIAIRDAELVDRTADRARDLGRLADLQADFLRGVSHNLQQPLTTIRLVADDLAAPDPIRAREAAVHIRAESDRLARLVGELLTMSRLDAGTIRIEAEPLAPGPLVRRAWASFRSSRRFIVDDRAPGMLAVADRACVEEILWILLDNALKYAPRGSVVVRIEPRPGDPVGGTAGKAGAGPPPPRALAITVVDTGPGVPVQERERIFERFVRGSTSAGADGSGLGLDVARGLARAMGGRLAYRDASPSGSAFELVLPAEPPLGPA